MSILPALVEVRTVLIRLAEARTVIRPQLARPLKALRHGAAVATTAAAVCACSTGSDSNAAASERLVVERSVDPEFTPSWSSAGLRVLQYARMAWAETGDMVAASVLQGPNVVVVEEDHRRAHLLQVSPRGSALAIAWLPGNGIPLAEGMDVPAGGKPTRAWFELKPGAPGVLGDSRRRPESVAARGIVLPGGAGGFVAIEAAGVAGIDAAPPLVVRDAGGVERMHFDPFPNDGARRQVVDADFQQAGDRVVMLTALNRVTRPGGVDATGAWIEPIVGSDIEVVDIFARRSICHLTFDDERINGFRHSFSFQGVAVSPDTHEFVVNTPKGALLYDVDSCRQLLALRDDRDRLGASGKWIAFSGDGRYIIRDGTDARSPKGGTLDVWRASDGRHVIHEETAAHSALAIKPGSTEFAAGRDDGQITFFRIENAG